MIEEGDIVWVTTSSGEERGLVLRPPKRDRRYSNRYVLVSLPKTDEWPEREWWFHVREVSFLTSRPRVSPERPEGGMR
jgi:hypothetical protein